MVLVFAAVHAPKRQPGEPKKGKWHRNADLVHEEDLTGLTAPALGSPGPGETPERRGLFALTYVSVGRTFDSVICVTKP